MKGKFKFGRNFLDTWKYYRDRGWKLMGISGKDTNGDYWLIMEKE